MGTTMRGDDRICGSLFSYIDLAKRIRADHPLRVIRQIANAGLNSLSSEFQKLYSPIGRESIPPERLMRALLLQAFYSIRSERQLVERIDSDLLFRWFVGLGIEDAVWDATTFTKNRDRLLDGAVASQFLAAVLAQDKVKRLLSSDHFSVDGALLEAWASPKSFRPKDGSGEPPGPGRNGEQDFHGERRTNDTHSSITDPDARLYRKGPGKEARLYFLGHALMENRNGLIVGALTTRASGHAERLAALALIEPHADRPQPVTLGADKGYDAGDFVMELRDKAVTPHVAQNTNRRRSAIDGRTTRHPGYAVSQRIRKRSVSPRMRSSISGGRSSSGKSIAASRWERMRVRRSRQPRVEEAFGWAKTVAGLGKLRHRGLPKVGWQFTLAMAAYNLVRLPKLLTEPA
jgi:transposase